MGHAVPRGKRVLSMEDVTPGFFVRHQPRAADSSNAGSGGNSEALNAQIESCMYCSGKECDAGLRSIEWKGRTRRLATNWGLTGDNLAAASNSFQFLMPFRTWDQ